MKKVIAVVFVLALLFSAVSCRRSDTVVIRIANNVPDDHPQSIVLADFKEIFESKTDGRFDVQIFNNNLLGTAEVYTDLLIRGTIQMALPGQIIAQNYPLAAWSSAPFLFRDWEHFRSVAFSDIVTDIYRDMPQAIGVRHFGQIPSGFRVVLSRVPIQSFDDFSGLRLRVPNIAVYIAFAQGIGASAITMALSELFSALEQGVVDAAENTYATLLTMRYHEIAPYLVETNHIFNTISFLVNEGFWQSLSSEDQRLMQASIDEAILRGWDNALASEREFMRRMQEEGATIFTPDAEFRQRLIDSQEEARRIFFNDYPGTEPFVRRIMEM